MNLTRGISSLERNQNWGRRFRAILKQRCRVLAVVKAASKAFEGTPGGMQRNGEILTRDK